MLFVKIVCDASFRLTIFGAWMYTLNDGVFSTKMTVAYYYIMVLIMIFVNIVFSWLEGDMEPCSCYEMLKNWIGKDQEFASISPPLNDIPRYLSEWPFECLNFQQF